MKKLFPTLIAFLFVISAHAQNAVPSAKVQIKQAELAAPAEKRVNTKIYGYAPNGSMVTLREGSNELICLADDPAQKGLSVACYHQDLEPFMARGRELKQAGKSSKEIFDMREQEVKSGKLKMPAQPSTLFVYSADQENVQASGEVKDGYLRYVVYIPYATSESTGLPLKPESPAMPWIMFPGTHGAHIMINPPMQKDTP
ncbi:hypothetical protein ACXYMU_16875 [Pontibacter sp. CAU 1760]